MRVNENAMRRLTLDEPVTRLAIWSRKLAQASLALALLAVAAAHAKGHLAKFFAIVTLQPSPVPDPGTGLLIFVVALVVALAALGVAAAAVAAIWSKGRRGVRPILATLLLLALFAPYPGWLIWSADYPPVLADISTNLDDPPAFSRSQAAVAARSGWTPEDAEASQRQEQADFYTDVKPIAVEMETQDAFKATHDAVTQLRWTIIEETLPGGEDQPDGRIEALAHSPVLNLPIAIVIRIRPGEDAATVDMRTVIRYLPSDLGAGAALIGKLSDALEEKQEAE